MLLIVALACVEPSSVGGLSFAEPPLLADLDPADGRFEGELTARAATVDLGGEAVSMLTFNGLVPGPQLRVAVGDEVSIRFRNQLPAGEGWPSGVHWHGIEGYNAADGTPLTQVATEPGEAFGYQFRATRAGVYWYHPHVRGAQALFSGLYAPMIVEDPAEAELVALGRLPADDRVLVLSDTWTFQGRVTSAESDNAMEVMNGTEGRTLLVNGQVQPELEVEAGAGVRLRMVNSSITRFWRVSVPGRTLYRVGGEGGLLDAVRVEGGAVAGERIDPVTEAALGPVDVDLGYARGEILLAPGERADVVLLTDGAPGDVLELRWEDYARGRHGMWMEGDEMVMGDAEDDGTREGVRAATFRLVEGESAPFTLAEGDGLLTEVGRAVPRVDDADAVSLLGAAGTTLEEEMDHVRDDEGEWEMTVWFGMNGASWHPMHDMGADQPEAPSARHARLGDTLRWEVHNTSMMAHPYHLHGFSYQPYELILWADEERGRAEAVRVGWEHLELEDTTLLPPSSSLRFLVELADPAGDGSAAGRWVQHCHILQHGEGGMMSELVVAP